VYIWVKVPLIVELKVIIPQQIEPIQSNEITNEVTVIGVVGGVGVGLAIGGPGTGLTLGGVGVLVGIGVGLGVGVGLAIGGVALIVCRVAKRSKIIRITATVNIEATSIRSVLLGLDSDIFIMTLAVRKLKIFSDKTNDKPHPF